MVLPSTILSGMAALTVQQVLVSGLVNPSFVAAAGGGDTFVNNGTSTFFEVVNGSGGSITVTFNDTGSVAPTGATQFNADVAVAVPAGQRAVIGPFATARFGGTVGVTYSGVSSLTVAAFRL